MSTPGMPLTPGLIGNGPFAAPSSIPPVVNAALGNAATQFEIRPGTGGGGVVRGGDLNGVHDPRNHVGSQFRLTEVRHTVPVRRSTRGYEKGLLQYTPMMILRRNGDPQEHAQIVSLPYANWCLQQTQLNDDTFWKLYSDGQRQQQDLRVRTASWALMQLPEKDPPKEVAEAKKRRAKFLRQEGKIEWKTTANRDGVQEVDDDWSTYSQSWGGALSTFVPFMGVVNVVAGNEPGISQSITPRCSFFAAGRAPIHHLWATNKEGTMLFFAIVPFDRQPQTAMNLTAGCSTDTTLPTLDDMRIGTVIPDDMHKSPYLKIPAWRNPKWTPDILPATKVYPVCFHKDHTDFIHRAVLRRHRELRDELNGLGIRVDGIDDPDNALADFYATIALEYVGMLVQAPERMPSSDDQRRAPFDLAAMRRLPTAFVSLEITNSV